jgi:DNA-binding NarL/FixJ family response regulator
MGLDLRRLNVVETATRRSHSVNSHEGGAVNQTARDVIREEDGAPGLTDDEGAPAAPAEGGQLFVVRAAVAAERARIAREMHDCVSKSLLGIAMLASSLALPRRPADPARLNERLRELDRLARGAVSEARCVINDLREDALGSAVRTVAAGWAIVAGVRISLAVPPGDDTTEEIRREIVGMLRDVLHNVERHAHASRVRVSLRRSAEGLMLTVTDNGRGFQAPADLEELRSSGRYGLATIAKRAGDVGGVLTIRSRPGGGTRVAIQIPVPGGGRSRFPAVRPAPALRVAIADENPVLRLGLRALLEDSPGIDIVADVGNGAEVADEVQRHQPDVLLLDARMPLADGLAMVTRLSRITQVVILVGADDTQLIARVLAAGARGYVVHGEFEPGELAQQVLEMVRRGPVRVPYAMEDLARRPGRNGGTDYTQFAGALTPREREVMGLIAEGLSNRQIAARLVISEKTVKNHISSIYERFGVYSRSQAVARWREL